MAFKPLSLWALKDSRDKVRMMLQIQGEQQESLFHEKANDLIYDATVQVRMLIRKLVDSMYSTTLQSSLGEFQEESLIVDLSGIHAVDYVSMLLYDLDQARLIPLKSDAEYLSLLSLYSSEATALLAHATNIALNGSNQSALEVFRGTGVAIAALTVTGVTTANPSEITTSVAHGLSTGDRVAIRGNTGTTAVNGIWPITRTAATKFTVLVNEPGTFGTGGTVTKIPRQRLTYNRIPVRPATDTAYIDLPDGYIPIMEDIACVSIARHLKKSPPIEVEQRAMSFVSSQMGQVGINITPAKK